MSVFRRLLVLQLCFTIQSRGPFVESISNVPIFGEFCSEDTEHCHANMECVNNICVCANHWVIASDGKQCLAGVGAQCENVEDCAGIQKYAVCQDNVCRCSPRLVPSASRSQCLTIPDHAEAPCIEDIQCQALRGDDSTCRSDSCVCKEGFHAPHTSLRCRKSVDIGDNCYDGDCYLPKDGTAQHVRCDGVCKCEGGYSYLDGQCSLGRALPTTSESPDEAPSAGAGLSAGAVVGIVVGIALLSITRVLF